MPLNDQVPTLNDVAEIIRTLPFDEAYDKCGEIAFIYFYGQTPKDHYKHNFEPKLKLSKREIEFQRFIYSLMIFANHDIPIEEWEDIAKEGLAVALLFAESPSVQCFEDLPNYRGYKDEFMKRLDKFRADVRYSERFISQHYL